MFIGYRIRELYYVVEARHCESFTPSKRNFAEESAVPEQ